MDNEKHPEDTPESEENLLLARQFDMKTTFCVLFFF